MSTRKGAGATRTRKPKHQNTFAFRHNPKSQKTAKILASVNAGLCASCHDKVSYTYTIVCRCRRWGLPVWRARNAGVREVGREKYTGPCRWLEANSVGGIDKGASSPSLRDFGWFKALSESAAVKKKHSCSVVVLRPTCHAHSARSTRKLQPYQRHCCATCTGVGVPRKRLNMHLEYNVRQHPPAHPPTILLQRYCSAAAPTLH